jgi:hypothetical protein
LRMSRIARLVSSAIALVFLLTAIGPAALFASVRGRRNTAIGLGAASVYSFAKGHTGAGIVLGAGSAYAYKRYKDQKNHRHSTRHRHWYTKNGHRHYYYSKR